jgi:hypothetical protein
VQDIAPIVQIVLVLAAVATPAILFARIVSGDSPLSFASMFYVAERDDAWPRGVQEEEPIHYALGAAGA